MTRCRHYSAAESSASFDDFALDTARYELRPRRRSRSGSSRKSFDVLTQLISNHDRFVTKEQLFDSVWGGRFVGEAALTSRIKAARRALGDDGESQRYIRHRPRCAGTSSWAPSSAGRGHHPGCAPEPAPAPRQHIAFCRAADGVRLAYAVAGEGPPLGTGGELDNASRLRHREPGVAALGSRARGRRIANFDRLRRTRDAGSRTWRGSGEFTVRDHVAPASGMRLVHLTTSTA